MLNIMSGCVRGMKHVVREGGLLVLGVAAFLGLILGPGDSQAAIGTTTQNWPATPIYSAAAYPSAAITYNAVAGNNRLLVVGISSSTTAITQAQPTVTYGGASMTAAIGYSGTATQQHTYLFYLPIGTSAAADTGKTIVVGISGGTSRYCIVNAAVYTGVDQTTPVVSPVRSTNDTTAGTVIGPFTSVVSSGQMGISILNAVGTGTTKTSAATITLGTTGHLWSQVSTAASGRIIGSLRTTFATTLNANTTTATQHTSSATSLNSTAAIVLKPIQGITVANGSTVAGNKTVYVNDGANSSNVVVDTFTMVADASTNVTNITFTANANTTSSRISTVKIWRKVGATLTAWEGTDVLVGSGSATGGAVSMTVNEPVSTAIKNYIVTYDINPTAPASTANLLTGTVTSITPAAIALTDTTALSASVYIYPTTTVGNGTEPPVDRLPKSSSAKNVDAFTLVHNGTSPGDDDTINSLTFTLTPYLISGGTGGTSSKIKLLEVVSEDGLTVYGSSTAPTSGDVWNIATPTLKATSTSTTYYLRASTADVITPSAEDTSGTLTGYYTFGGTITLWGHLNANNKVVENDSSSQTLIIDVEAPTGPAAARAVTGTVGGTIDLDWDDASTTDPHAGTLHATTPYVVRRDTTQPLAGCTTGTAVTLTPLNQSSLRVTDTGLIDTTATRYYYRVCAMDAQGNISSGVITEAFSKVSSICNNAPTVTLKAEDNSDTQIIKSADKSASTPFTLTILNNDIGVCEDIVFKVELASESAAKLSGSFTPDIAHFSKTIDGQPFTESTTLTVGTGAPNAGKVKTAKIYISGLSTSNQLEQYIFAIKATDLNTLPASTNGSVTSSLVTGLLNDMPPIVHNNSNMGKTQYGNWGQEFTCATCHSNSTTNIKGVYTIISTAKTGRRNVVFTKTSSSETDYDGVMGNDKRPNKDTSNYVCSVCHTKTRQHQYSASKVNFNNPETQTGVVGPYGNEMYVTDHHNSADCARCHTHNTAFRSIYGACGDCHGNKGTKFAPYGPATMVKEITLALGNPPPNGAHERHNRAKLACTACHSNTNHGTDPAVWTGDGKIDMGFTIDKDTFPGFNPAYSFTVGTFNGTNSLNQNPTPFSWYAAPGTTLNTVPSTSASCNTYCHGRWTGNVGSMTSPDWVTPGQAACGTCHNASGTATPVSGSHERHAGTTGMGMGMACSKCHATYASYTGSAHINGTVQWKLSGLGSSAAYKGLSSGSTGTPAPTTDYGTYGACTNVYCHSNVQGADGSGSPTAYANPAPVWGGTVTCGSCHAEPNTSGSHSAHENAEVSFDCHVCHNNGGYTNPLNHANGNINFQFVGLGQNTVYSLGNNVPAGTKYGTCSASNCHGRFTRAWGSPDSGLPICDKCHGSATSPRGFYNTRGPDGTLSIYSAAIGVHDIHLQNLNSPRKTAFNRFTSYAKGLSCNQCHIVPSGPFTAGHIDTPTPAEVPFSHVSSIANTGQAKFSYYTSPSYTSATQTCSSVWCHGAGMNSNNSSGPYAGVPAGIQRQNPQWNAPFLTGNAAQDCTMCHAMPPPAPDANYIHFNKTMADCKTCHTHLTSDGYGFKDKSLHVNGKIDGGCDKCHGYPPINNIVGDREGLASPAQGALQLGTAGAHGAHVQNASIGKNCQTCHYNFSSAMPSNNLELGFSAFNGAVTSGTFTGYSNSGAHPQWIATNATTNILKVTSGANVCSNLYCHGGGTTTLSALGGGSNTTPNWEGGSTDAICGTCHGTDTTSAPTGGSHARHALAANGGAGLLCASCHGPTADMSHVNASVSWKLDRSNPAFGPNATYNNISSGSIAGLAPRNNGTDYKTCDNLYCHSNVQGTDGAGKGAPTTYGSPRWGADNNMLTCGSCHTNMATDLAATGSHVKHANTTQGNTNMALSCGYCHQDGGSGSLNHADNLIFVNFTGYVGGTYANNGRTAGSAAGYGSCSTTFCHGTNPSPTWGTAGPLDCNACHSAKVDDISWSGRHKTHYNYSTMPTSYTQTVTDLSTAGKYRFNCAHCHDDNVARHSLKPASTISAARVFFGISSATPAASSKRGSYVAGAAQGATDNGFKFTAGSCNTSYCHSNGRGGAPLNTTLTWTTTPTAPGGNCAYCHDTKSTTATATQLSGKHDKHMNPTNNAMIGTGNGFNCADCHARVITNINNTTIANKGKHVNAYLDYSGIKAGKTYDGSAKVCSNVYCHSNGNPNAVVFVSMTGSKTWTGSATITTCNKCHGRSTSTGYPDYANGGANTATSNLHAGHMAGLTDTLACADCHRRTVDSGIANKFRAYTTTHLSGGTNVNFNTVKTYIGTKATATTAGLQVTCSNVVCHGQGAPVWGSQPSGGAGVRTCTKCHGTRTATDYLTNYSSAIIAPGYNGEGTDTSMTKALATDVRVGAHQRHLVSNVISAPVKCGECHVTVTSIRSANHWNYSTATLTFGGRATANGHIPSVIRTGGIIQCSNTNCHTGKYNSGTSITPLWNNTGLVNEAGTTVAECEKCHAMPPSGYGNHPAALSSSAAISTIYASCGSCHTNLRSSGVTDVTNVFTDKTQHINGTINYVANCNGCHAYDLTGGGTTWTPALSGGSGTGAHIKHIAFIKSRLSIASLTATGQTFGIGEPAAVCGTCHTNTASDHDNGSRQITFGAGGATPNTMGAGYSGSMTLLFGGSNPAYTGAAKSCSNISCHYFTTPSWY